MSTGRRIENALLAAVAEAGGQGCAPGLSRALHHAVFPGGKRVRPRLVLAVAAACGVQDAPLALPAAVAIELLHCASLVHDDLPCFDDAGVRRGQPSVHAAFGVPIAVLTGDALIVLAFDALAAHASSDAVTAARLMRVVAGAVGAPSGIVSGQAWETEAEIDIEAYHRAKTASLFSGAAAAGAIAAGADPAPWQRFGDGLGLAFQVADDMCDAFADQEEIGKPVARDEVLGRPNAVRGLDLAEAVGHVEGLIEDALSEVPQCPGRTVFCSLVEREARRLLPSSLARVAA